MPVGVRGELDRCVESEQCEVRMLSGERLDRAEVGSADTESVRLSPPHIRSPPRVRKPTGPVNEQERPAVDPDMAGVGERLGQRSDVTEVVVGRVCLAEEDLPLAAAPRPPPLRWRSR